MDKIRYRDILRQKEYMKLMIADVINRFGDSIDSIAFVWLVYQVTNSAAWSSIIYGVNRIPTVFLQPFAGALIERIRKKRIMVYTDIIRGICVGFIAIAYAIGFLNQWYILLTTLIISSSEAFRGPASNAIVPKLLESKYYEFGLSFNRSASSIVEMIGLSAAGIIVAQFSVTTAIFIDMATFFISALILSLLKANEETLSKSRIEAKEYRNSLMEGFTYLKSDAFLKYIVILALFLNAILVPFNSLLAPLISEVLQLGELMLSVVSTTVSVGMIIGATLYPFIGSKVSKRAIVISSGYSIGLYYFAFIVVGHFIAVDSAKYILIGIFSVVVGAVTSILSSMTSVEFMKHVKEEYLARSTSITNAICTAAMPLASFVISAVAGFTSTAVLFIISGILDFIICAILARKKYFIGFDEERYGDAVDKIRGGTEGQLNGGSVQASVPVD